VGASKKPQDGVNLVLIRKCMVTGGRMRQKKALESKNEEEEKMCLRTVGRKSWK
jgi:hypothetical protein